MRTTRNLFFVSLSVAALAACTEPNPAFVDADPCDDGEYFVEQEFQLADPRLVDILFVVDNRDGMLANQEALADAMPGFVSTLSGVANLDWRVAVTTTDVVRDPGALSTGVNDQPGCPGGRPPIVTEQTASAAAVAACNVLVGEGGDDFPQGMQAAKQALDAANNFRRDDARLVIVFFSNTDDCSGTSQFDRSTPNNCVLDDDNLIGVGDFARYFSDQASQRSGNPVSIVSITGPAAAGGGSLEPVCESITEAFGGNRYIALGEIGRLARVSAFSSICASDFGDALSLTVEEAVLHEDDELCLALPMASAPRSVVTRAVSRGTETGELDPLGEFLVTGATDSCANGAVSISAERDPTDGNVVAVRFCTPTEPN
jgi:hypothetical protein